MNNIEIKKENLLEVIKNVVEDEYIEKSKIAIVLHENLRQIDLKDYKKNYSKLWNELNELIGKPQVIIL